jgi:hypothetical protein
MRQVLHIFAKDVRHLWVEIAISLALVITEVLTGHLEWTVRGPQFAPEPNDFLRLVVSVLMPLIVISWMLLIARVIQSEALVGDRQFWITRPYDWKRFMAAKLLFLATFVFAPFFLMQLILLGEAGFSPVHWLPTLALNLVFLAGIILPLAALGTVTPSFGRIVVVLLGLVLCAVAIFALSALGGTVVVTAASAAPVMTYLDEAITLIFACAVIVVQYRTRKTKVAWLLLVALLACYVAIGFIAPDRRLMDRTYPPVENASGAPVQLSYKESEPEAADGERGYSRGEVNQPPQPLGKWTTVNVPIQLSGIRNESAILFNSADLSVDAANGKHWSSGWRAQQGSAHRTESNFWMAQIQLPTKTFKEFSDAPVTVHLTAALTEIRARGAEKEQLPQPQQEFMVSDFGICAPQKGNFKDAVNLICRFPWRAPMTYIATRWFDGPCASVDHPVDPGIEGDGWVGLGDNVKSWMFFPVASPYISLSNSMQLEHNRPNWRRLCPGAPVTFTHYEVVRRAQESLTISNFDLGKSAEGN